jgi:hypothetical protein
MSDHTFFQRASTVPPKDTREKRWRMICDSGCLARRRSWGGGYRKVTGRFGISRPLNSYIHDICDIFGAVLSVSPPRSDPSACAEVLVDFFRTSAPTEPPASKGPGTYSGRSILVAINVLLHFFPATEIAPSPSRAYQTAMHSSGQRYAGETVLYFPSRGRICALQHPAPGAELYARGARRGRSR